MARPSGRAGIARCGRSRFESEILPRRAKARQARDSTPASESKSLRGFNTTLLSSRSGPVVLQAAELTHTGAIVTKKNTKGSGKVPGLKRRVALDIEVEVKIRCDDVDRLLSSGLSVEIEEDRHLEDNYVFQLPDGKLRKGQYLRIRHTGDGEGSGRRRAGVLTYKGKPRRVANADGGKNKGKKVREEIETTVGQPPKLVKILKRLGLRRSFRYQKYRTIFRVTLPDGRSLDAMYDETPIGNFLELEGDAAIIEAVAAALGYGPSQFVADSYVEMHMKRSNSPGEVPTSDMLFEATKERQAKKRARGKQRATKGSKAAADADVAVVETLSEPKPKKASARSKRKSSKQKAKVATTKKATPTGKSAAKKRATSSTAKPKDQKKKAVVASATKGKARSRKATNAVASKPKSRSKKETEPPSAVVSKPSPSSKASPKGNGNGVAHARRKPRAEHAPVVETQPPDQPVRARARSAAG
jgi:adenylate cyclase, class 2